MYCSTTDIEKRLDPKHLAELADDDADGSADTAILEAAIADADALIDTCLAVRYSTPLSEPPAILSRLSADLAIASLFARRRESASPLHADRARDAMDILGRIASGELILSGIPIHAPDTSASTTLGTDPRFRKDGLAPY